MMGADAGAPLAERPGRDRKPGLGAGGRYADRLTARRARATVPRARVLFCPSSCTSSGPLFSFYLRCTCLVHLPAVFGPKRK